LLFKTRNGTPHLHNNIEERWLTERLKTMQLDEPGMGWHAFRRFRNTWLRRRRCQEDIKNFWMGHKPRTMSEVYSHLFEEVDLRLAEFQPSLACSKVDLKLQLRPINVRGMRRKGHPYRLSVEASIERQDVADAVLPFCSTLGSSIAAQLFEFANSSVSAANTSGNAPAL
jgi:hypothetical protein